MCRTTAYRSTACGHRWLTITTRCGPNMGFTTTPVHEFRSDASFLTIKPNFQKAPAGSCPNCDKKGEYDGNTTRMVLASGEKEIQRNILRTSRGEAMLGGRTFGYTMPAGAVTIYGTGVGNGYASMHYADMTTTMGGQNMTLDQQQFAAQQQHHQAVLGRGQHHVIPVAQRYTYGYRAALDHSSCTVM